MPREDRRIIFDYAETYRAIYGLSVQKRLDKPPPGAITAITISPDDNQKITIKIENPQASSATDKSYTRDFLAAALMLYCRSVGIPLLKRALKSVEFSDGVVILRIVI